MKCSAVLSAKENNYTPSGKIAVFRLPHLDFVDNGNDGVAYLNTSQTTWETLTGGKVKVISKEPTIASPEALTKFQVSFDGSKKVIIKAQASINSEAASFSDSPNIWGNATGVRLRVSSSDPEMLQTLIIGSGKNPLKISFKAPSEPTDIVIPIPQKVFDADAFSTNIFFQFEKSNQKNVSFEIFGPIIFERDIFSQVSKARSYLRTHFKKDSDFNDRNYNSSQQVMLLAIKNLANPDNQKRALEIGKMGEDAILKELYRLGFLSEFSLKEKISVSDFFVSSHKNLSEDEAMVPAEIGEFAREHGRSSHAMQIIAMTNGMSGEQINIFMKEIYRKTFTREVNRWAAWDMLFDAPGDAQPNSPLWWRKQLEE